jgi:PBP1b-binding outer membrane lipoprotein LpoB
MKKIGLMLGVAFVLQGCSGVAPEAQRDENNELLKPPFLAEDKTTAKATEEE